MLVRSTVFFSLFDLLDAVDAPTVFFLFILDVGHGIIQAVVQTSREAKAVVVCHFDYCVSPTFWRAFACACSSISAARSMLRLKSCMSA